MTFASRRTRANADVEGVSRPVVVLFHGFSSAGNEAADAVDHAQAAANAGIVVFTPEWIVGDPFPLLLDDVERQHVIGNCAVATAQLRDRSIL